MKKTILTLAILLGCTLTISAQKVINQTNRTEFVAVPSVFTYNHTPYLQTVDRDREDLVINLTIYDASLNPVCSFSPNEKFADLELECYIDKNGFQHDVPDNMYLTQTFFNDDEDWEYIVPVEEEVPSSNGETYMETVSFSIKKLMVQLLVTYLQTNGMEIYM